MTNGITAPHIVWDDAPVDVTANQAIAAAAQALKDGGALQEAKAFLRDILADGPIPAEDGEEAARAHLISKITLKRARKALGVVSNRSGGLGGEGHWQWSPKGINRRSLRGSSLKNDPLSSIVRFRDIIILRGSITYPIRA